jgi:hypothetical protein
LGLILVVIFIFLRDFRSFVINITDSYFTESRRRVLRELGLLSRLSPFSASDHPKILIIIVPILDFNGYFIEVVVIIV